MQPLPVYTVLLRQLARRRNYACSVITQQVRTACRPMGGFVLHSLHTGANPGADSSQLVSLAEPVGNLLPKPEEPGPEDCCQVTAKSVCMCPESADY